MTNLRNSRCHLLFLFWKEDDVMRKKAHVYLAKYLADNLEWEELCDHRKAFCLGSFLPDCKPSFLTVPHHYNKIYDRTIDMIEELVDEANSDMNMRVFCRRLGEVTHYIADSFTYPHNAEVFPGHFIAHCRYEKYLTIELRKYMTGTKIDPIREKYKKMESVQEIEAFFQKAHAAYLEGIHGLERDITFIIEACFQIVEAIIEIFHASHQNAYAC